MRSLVVTAPAKVNLFLGVGSLRADGFHAVQTVFHTLTLADTVRLTPADELSVTCSIDLGIPAKDNLAFRAASQFASVFDVDVLLEIDIEKRIPWGAGLGGGSSDAAAVLAGLAHWAGLPIDDERLQRAARAVGADVAFLTLGGAALMGGRGDKLTRRLRPVSAHVALVKPPSSVPTGQAYRAFDASPTPAGEARRVADALRTEDVSALAVALANNLTAASSGLVPEISDALTWLAAEPGVLGSAMAGSGSAVFAICEQETDAQRIADVASERGWWGVATQTSAAGATVAQGDDSA
jgi:4-diphosphocytidyl-2-C-methyl-D-erythritol kinase